MNCRVVIVGFTGYQPLDIVGPHEVFVGASLALRLSSLEPAYAVTIGSLGGGLITGESGMRISTVNLPDPASLTSDDVVLVAGGTGVEAALNDVALVHWISAAARSAGRVTSVCTGALLLAEAGLLDGRRATTHWTRLDQLATGYPLVTVDRDALFINDAHIWTSAGVTAGIDMALALVEADHGTELAQTIARHLVMFLRRPGGQSQFAAPVWQPSSDHELIRTATEFISTELANDLSVSRIAGVCNTSTRHLTRLFKLKMGVSPARFVELRRMELARNTIESDPDLALTQVARRCGFGTSETLRRTFLRNVGVSPDDYRHRFSSVSLQ